MRRPIKLLSLLVLPTIIVWQAAQANTFLSQGQQPPSRQSREGQPNQPQNQDGVEVQGRGQVHEAFASPALPRQSPAPVVQKKPPEAINELPPEQKPEGDNVQWIPGYWMWDQDRTDFLWVSGTWRNIPPEKRWLPGYWVDAEGGYRWVSGYWKDQAETQVNLYPEPPAPVEEAAAVIENADQTYIPGIWVYRDNRYWWRPGFRMNYSPGWMWTPASYRWTPGGYAFVDGYWDYDLSRRGIAFAPVFIDPRISVGTSWYYRPRFVIATDFLLGSLFVNAGWNHYYFGDYYDTTYSQRGFSPWISYRSSNRFYDPLFSYYRWEHRGDARWERNIQQEFTARRDGSMARPGRTLAQLERTSGVANQQGTKVNALVSLDQWKGDQFKLQRLTAGEDKKIVNHYRTMSTERIKNETGKRTSMYPPGKATDKEGQVERREGSKDTPPVKLPPVKERTSPPPTGSKEIPNNVEPSNKVEPSRQYDLPKSEHTYRSPTGEHAPPQRPVHPQPMQNPPSKGSNNPGKKSG